MWKSYHSRDNNPAKDAAHHSCQKKGHFSSQCIFKRPATQHSVDISSLHSTPSNDETIIFLDDVLTGSVNIRSLVYAEIVRHPTVLILGYNYES